VKLYSGSEGDASVVLDNSLLGALGCPEKPIEIMNQEASSSSWLKSALDNNNGNNANSSQHRTGPNTGFNTSLDNGADKDNKDNSSKDVQSKEEKSGSEGICWISRKDNATKKTNETSFEEKASNKDSAMTPPKQSESREEPSGNFGNL